MAYCANCGKPIKEGSNFCPNCGHRVGDYSSSMYGATAPDTGKSNNEPRKTIISRLNNYLGNKNPANLNWKVLFSDVFRKHTKEEGEEVFIVGTKTTTPDPQNLTNEWPHPWLYSRVLGLFLLSYLLLLLCVEEFNNMNAMPGMIVIGAFAVPLATAIMFMELNVWRDTSMYTVIKTFLLGGVASLVATLILFEIYPVGELDYLGAIMVGIIEEVGKLVIVFWFMKKLRHRSILSGMLIGASVGAGFAAFESAGYAFKPLMNYLFSSGYAASFNQFLNGQECLDAINENIILRGVLAPGGHVTWAAISGAALAIASKGKESLTIESVSNIKFLRLFIIPVILHAIWDCPLMNFFHSIIPFSGLILLVVAVWIVALILIDMGLAEVDGSQPASSYNQDSQPYSSGNQDDAPASHAPEKDPVYEKKETEEQPVEEKVADQKIEPEAKEIDNADDKKHSLLWRLFCSGDGRSRHPAVSALLNVLFFVAACFSVLVFIDLCFVHESNFADKEEYYSSILFFALFPLQIYLLKKWKRVSVFVLSLMLVCQACYWINDECTNTGAFLVVFAVLISLICVLLFAKYKGKSYYSQTDDLATCLKDLKGVWLPFVISVVMWIIPFAINVNNKYRVYSTYNYEYWEEDPVIEEWEELEEPEPVECDW